LSHANARAVSAAVANAVEVVKADNALIVVSVRKENDHKVETVAPVRLRVGHRVHRVIAPHVRKDRVVSVPRVNHVHRVNVQRVLKVNVRHVRRQSNLYR
jgi:hypothetical protein